MASIVDICNKALSYLGQAPIISIDESNAAALACRSHWPILIKSVLRGHKWNCVKRRARLARLSEAPTFGYKYYYQLPSNCLMALSLDCQAYFEVEGRKLLTDADVADLHFIENPSDVTIFDPQLAHAISYLLAGEMCFQMTSSSSEAARLQGTGVDLLKDAKASDAFEGKQRKVEKNRLLRAHYG